MTTPTSSAAETGTGERTEERVRNLTRALISEKQRGFLADRPSAVAALARLRRGAGKQIAQVPDLWGLVDTGPLAEVPEGRRRPTEAELTRAEDAVHVAVTLWALHQQSRGTAMHRLGSRAEPRGLGTAARALMRPGDIDEPVRKRFVRAGTAPTLSVLAQRLREIVLLLRGADIPLDYGLLAEQLYLWQSPGGQETVRRAWGRSFHSYRPAGATGDDTTGSGSAAPDDSTDTPDKDAS
ncbi:type I-E CRISPR-associated protein Cse2/CasB [Streptomyces tsukubensis]